MEAKFLIRLGKNKKSEHSVYFPAFVYFCFFQDFHHTPTPYHMGVAHWRMCDLNLNLEKMYYVFL